MLQFGIVIAAIVAVCVLAYLAAACYNAVALCIVARRLRLQECALASEEWEAKARAWDAKAKRLARQLLNPSASWREQDAEAMEEFVFAMYNGEAPDYLWYALGANNKLSGEEWDAVREFFRPEGDEDYGCFEVHTSGNKDIGFALRVRNHGRPTSFFAASVVCGGQECPLYQTGCSYGLGPQEGVINLVTLLEKLAPVTAS